MIVTRFEPDQGNWIDAVCFNIDGPSDARAYRLGTSIDSPHFGKRPIVETFEELLHRYFYHPESKCPRSVRKLERERQQGITDRTAQDRAIEFVDTTGAFIPYPSK